jgi:hypothetical protein
MAAAAGRLGVSVDAVKRAKRKGSYAFKGSRVNVNELAQEIKTDEQPGTFLFEIPVDENCDPKIIENFREMLRTAIRCCWLSAPEGFEIFERKIVEVLRDRKVPRRDAEKLTVSIHTGFGAAAWVLAPDDVDIFLKKSGVIFSTTSS